MIRCQFGIAFDGLLAQGLYEVEVVSDTIFGLPRRCVGSESDVSLKSEEELEEEGPKYEYRQFPESEERVEATESSRSVLSRLSITSCFVELQETSLCKLQVGDNSRSVTYARYSMID